VHRIVFSLNQKCGRRLSRDGDAGLRVQVARIDDHGEVGTATEIVRSINRGVEPLVKVIAERRGKMSSGGEAEHPDAVRVNMPFGGVRADDSHGALGVLESGGRLGVRARIRHAVFHEHTGNARGIEPVTHLRSLEIHGQDVVAAAGENQHGCAVVPAHGRVERERGF